MTDYERQKFMAALGEELRPLVKVLQEIADIQSEALKFQRQEARGSAHKVGVYR